MTRAEEERAAERTFKRSMAVLALEDLIRRVLPEHEYTPTVHHEVEAVVDALIEAMR